jgi:exosortase A-associated hydrolase 2
MYVHPFGEEMNKSRRMVALQARAFAANGFGMLQIDLFGCGDSSGEFGNASWNLWKQDLGVAKNWLENRVAAPVSLWGLRLGALLALDFARDLDTSIDQIILWQPVLKGKSFLTQFLRLRLAGEILSADADTQEHVGTDELRSLLQAGNTLEVAGYELSPELATVIDKLDAAELRVTKSPIHWIEIVAELGRSISPAGSKVVNLWKQGGVDVHVYVVPCVSFWATQEISECPALVSSTTGIFRGASA